MTFSFRVNDGTFFSAYDTGTITVIGTNDLPTVSNDSYTGTEDVSQTVFVLANDADGDGNIVALT